MSDLIATELRRRCPHFEAYGGCWRPDLSRFCGARCNCDCHKSGGVGATIEERHDTMPTDNRQQVITSAISTEAYQQPPTVDTQLERIATALERIAELAEDGISLTVKIRGRL